MSAVCFGGSRSLSPAFAPLVGRVGGAALARGALVSVGCAAGADAVVVSAVLAAGLPSLLRVCAVGGPSGRGFWSGSAPFSLLRRAASSGARVLWLAGGGLSVPLRSRLFARSLSSLRGCSAAVFFLASPFSSGSLSVAAAAARAGLRVFAFSCGFAGAPVALRGVSGAWVSSSFLGFCCWSWVPC